MRAVKRPEIPQSLKQNADKWTKDLLEEINGFMQKYRISIRINTIKQM